MPENVRDEVAERRDKARIRGLWLERGARSAFLTLQKGGITDVAPLKGSYLLPRIYKDYGMRTTNDVDLLVKKSTFELCHQCMLDDGYVFVPKPVGRPISQHVHYERSYRAPEGHVVDLHWGMAQETRVRQFYDEMWANSSVISEGPLTGFSEFRPEEVFLILCIHIGQDNFQGPFRQWIDLMALLAFRELDFALVVNRARAAGVEILVWCVLERLKVLNCLSIDVNYGDLIGPRGTHRKYLQRLMKREGLTPLPFQMSNRLAQMIIALPAMDGWPQRRAVVWEQVSLRIRDVISRVNSSSVQVY